MLDCIVLCSYIWCSGIQYIYAQLTGGFICLIYICSPKSSSWCSGMQGIYAPRGVHLPAIYMHCPRFSSWCSRIQGIYARLTGEDLCWISLCYAHIFGVAVFNTSMLDWPGGVICLVYICIVLNLAFGVAVCKASVLQGGSICLLYICIVLDLAVGVAVFKASMLDWLGRNYAELHCAMLICLV